MQNLWAPWRMDYILRERRQECIFCPEGNGESDEERLILHRGERSMVMMNRFPYSNGHLLIAPWKHTPTLDGLDDEELLDLTKTVRWALAVLRKTLSPDGFNVGLNLGTVAGAGYKAHVHFHVVPRWNGDTNFMTVFAEVRVIPEHLQQTYRRLLRYFEKESLDEIA
ncbi:MAG: HIT family protein [Syntrophobacteria bacterium]